MTCAWHIAALEWAVDTFGPVASDPRERAMRLIEEALEFGQTQGVTAADLAAITARVTVRPAGEPQKECAQVGLTLVFAAANLGFDLDAIVRAEFARARSMPKEIWAKRHAAKVAVGAAVRETEVLA